MLLHRNSLALAVLLGSMAALTGCPTDGSSDQAPLIAGLPTEATIVVGDTLRYQVSATDPEGGAVSFDYDWRPKERPFTLDQAVFFASGSEATFEWSPIASDVTDDGEPLRLIFIVEDQAGQRTEKTVALTIVPGNGQPRFTSNASELFDPRSGAELSFEVAVRDDDSRDVELTMDPASAPVGSNFEQTGPLSGTFTWSPGVEQLSRRVHTVTFKANDRQNPVVDHRVTIVVRQGGAIDVDKDQTSQACPGEALITHAPLGPQRTLQPYVVEATIADAARFEEVFLYWTMADAYNGDFDPNDDSKRLLAVPMEGAGGSLRAEIPNQFGYIPDGGAATIYYNICAIDRDSSTTPVVCAPSSGDLELFWSFAAYQPATESCADDSLDRLNGNDDIASSSNITTSWSAYRVCDGNPDFHRIQVRPGESYLLTATFPKGQPLTVKALDESGGAINLQQSACTGLVSAEVSVAEGGQPKTFYVQATGDDVDYQLRAIPLQGGEGGCVDAAMEPNEDPLGATAIVAGDRVSAEICAQGDRDIYKIALNAGDAITVTNTFNSSAGNLDMDLYAPSQADQVTQNLQGIASTFSFESPEVLEHTATETGTYYLKVFNNDPTSNAYELQVAVAAAPTCPDTDTYSSAGSGNHTQSSAATIPSPQNGELITLPGLTLCAGKPDWYQRTELAGVAVLGELEVTGGEGNLGDVSLDIYNLQGDLVASATPSGNTLDFYYTPGASAQLFYKVSTTRKIDYVLSLLR